MPRYYYANGKRKTSVAKVRLTPKGKGEIVINTKPLKEYFGNDVLRGKVLAPLKIVGMDKDVDVSVLVTGGGITGQAEAIRHGVTRALLEVQPELRTQLKKAGFLTRDPRVVERKKYGRAKSRKSFQFSKR